MPAKSPANNKRPHNVGLMLGQNHRRWTNIKSALDQAVPDNQNNMAAQAFVTKAGHLDYLSQLILSSFCFIVFLPTIFGCGIATCIYLRNIKWLLYSLIYCSPPAWFALNFCKRCFQAPVHGILGMRLRTGSKIRITFINVRGGWSLWMIVQFISDFNHLTL